MPAWTLPSANQGAWTPGTNVGVPGDIEQYLAGKVNDRAVTGNVIDITQAPYNADDTGTTSVTSAVQDALTAAVSGDVIYFPAGDYLFATGGIQIPTNKPNVTIRGAGVGVTTFHASTSQAIFVCPDPGYIPQDILTVTGTKTKGTATLTVSSNSGYTTTDQFAYVAYENEADNARIQAGAAPVWSSRGYPWSRVLTARVTGTTGTSISIDPPLPADATSLALRIYNYGYQTYKFVGWGFEDFSVTFDNADHPPQIFNMTTMQYSWFYNLHFEDYSRQSSNGSCIKITKSYRCQIQHCRFDAVSILNHLGNETVSSDGAVETGSNSSNLVFDNIFTGPWGFHTYDSGNSVNGVIAYNFSTGVVTGFHNVHPSLNLVEGNVATNHHSDGYHGSSSHNTLYRNWFSGAYGSIILNRFKRNYVMAGNLLGEDGVAEGGVSYGNPNMGNGDANGFAGPTGLSDQVGETDYVQNGGTPNTYVIQEADVFAGDFWNDWEVTGTLDTRTSDTVGVFTVSGGNWVVGTVATASGDLGISAWWNNKEGSIGAYSSPGAVTNVAGNVITISWGGGTLPAEGTTVKFYFFNSGWQERDLDVRPSCTRVENYHSAGTGTGSIQDGTSDTLPDSLAWTSKPAWFGNLPWPPFDPNDPVFGETRIPAGYRYVNENEDYIGGVATPQFSPAPGTFGSSQNVTITSATSGATIYYTTNGSTPTTGSTVYSGAVTISATTTLKAIAVKAAMTDSSVQSGTYTILAAPTAPSSLSASVISTSQINLTWADNSSTESSFKIEQKVGSGGSWNEIYTASANATSYSVTGLSPGTQYFFRVYATNVAGDSSYSNEANGTTTSAGTSVRRRSARFPRKAILVLE